MYIFSAIVLGLMGSFHCIGMCGPIALALPLNKSSWWSKVIGLLQYNFGRAITYAILGAIFGVLGESFSLGGYQRKISIIMGSLMIISVLFPALFRWHRKLDVIIINIQSELKKRFGLIFAKQSNKHLIIIG